jgi:amidase
MYILLRNGTKHIVDDPGLQHGTPIGVQLVGRRFQEEKMIAIAEMFEKALATGKGLPN